MKAVKKGATLPGLHARNFPAPLREFIDVDYLDRLSPEEKAWLAKFNDEFHGGCFRANPLHGEQAQRRAIWRAKKAARHDALGVAKATSALEYPDGAFEEESQSWESIPATPQLWLDPAEDQRHVQAVKALKESLPELPANDRTRPKQTPARAKKHAQAVRKLVAINEAQLIKLKASGT